MAPAETFFHIMPIYQVTSWGSWFCCCDHDYLLNKNDANSVAGARVVPMLAYTTDGGETCTPFAVKSSVRLKYKIA